VTTHHAALQVEADEQPDYINAAVEFNIETLRPTYKLVWGEQGASNALSVARALGFDRTVVARGEAWKERLCKLTQSKAKSSNVAAAVRVCSNFEGTLVHLLLVVTRAGFSDAYLICLNLGVGVTKALLKINRGLRANSVQAEIATAEIEVAATVSARRKRDDVVQQLERELDDVEKGAAELQRSALEATAQAQNDAARIRGIEQDALKGKLPLDAAVAKLEALLLELPDVQVAQRRLLGLQMGGEVLDTEDGAEALRHSSDDAAWLPATGEEVLARPPLLNI
jgi:hypothetical protein